MEYIRRVQDFEQLKILSDSRRLAILRLLMASPATLSQLGQVLGEHPARIRHHVKQLEKAGLIEMVETRLVRGFVEKYYQARARAFVFHEIILPESADEDLVVIIGSHDLALEVLVQNLKRDNPGSMDFLVLPVGSLEGLIALRQRLAQVAGCHLLDDESGEYNLPYVRHFFPDRDVTLITLAHRRQGLLVRQGNPLQIHGLEDLARGDVTMVNRIPGSGTRLWLDKHLEKLSLSPSSLRGYERSVRTHTAVAEAVCQGKADTGLALQAAAQRNDLDFIPLFEERFDLVIPDGQMARLKPMLDYMESDTFRQAVEDLGGYSTVQTGERLTP